MIVYKYLEILFNTGIDSLSLTIGLWVECKRGSKGNAQLYKEMSPELGDKLGPSV
jgi:hypothetical protein